MIHKKDFGIFEVLIKKEKYRLCNIHKATVRGESMLCKDIELDRVTNYAKEAFLNILVRIDMLKLKDNFMHISAFSFNATNF
jgi:hypothetical protein